MIEARTVNVEVYDVSDIPAHIIAAFNAYNSVPHSDYYPERTTRAQKRTRTMRFNKLVRLCEDAGVDLSSVLFRLGNNAASVEMYGDRLKDIAV